MKKNTVATVLGLGAALTAAVLITGRGKRAIGYREGLLAAYRKTCHLVTRSRTARRLYSVLLGWRGQVRKAVPDPLWSDALIKNNLYSPDFHLVPETGGLELPRLGLSLTREQVYLLDEYEKTLHHKEAVEELFDTQYERDAQGAILASAGGLRVRVDTLEGYGLLWEMLEERTYDYDLGEPFAVWDIGMNAGLASLFFATISNVKMVFGFEPFPRTFAAAEYNISLNPDLSSKIRPFNAAVGDADGVATAFDNQELRGGNSLRYSNKRVESDVQVELVVRDACAVLDEIMAASGGLPLVCKLDAEGAEYTIIPALARAGRLGDIRAFLMEFHMEGSEALEPLLRDAGFRVAAHLHSPGSPYGYLYAAQPGTPFPSPVRESARRVVRK